MIDLYYAPTPNGWKISIMLEETGLPYRVIPLDLTKGDQDDPEFRKISPNGRIPAMIDTAPDDGGAPQSLFESGAILIYLAEKSAKFMPTDREGYYTVLKWLMWQMSGLGPMIGQSGHFKLYAPEPVPYAIDRYGREVRRLYSVLDTHLVQTDGYIAGDYSIADMACFPWIMTHKRHDITLDDYPALKAWFARVRARDGVQRGLAVGGGPKTISKPMTDEARAQLFGLKTKDAT